MGCYFHPEAEAVVTCGRCGVAMCRECESNAFFRLDQGRGQALCNKCSLDEAQSNVYETSSWLKKRLVKIITCAIFVFVGIFFYIVENTDGLIFTIPCWFIAGIISYIGLKVPAGSLKSQAKDAVFEYEHPFLNLIAKIIGYTIAAPIMLISLFVGYAKTKSMYKDELNTLHMIQSALENQ